MTPAALCGLVRKSLDSEIGLKSPHDGIACLAHACLLSYGFTFVGLGLNDTSPSASTTIGEPSDKEISSSNVSTLPSAWNSIDREIHVFRYTLSERKSILRVKKDDAKILISHDTMAGDDSSTLEVSTEKYTNSANYPWKEGNATPLVDAFVSMSRIKEFEALFASKLSLNGKTAETSALYDLQDHIRSQPLQGRAAQPVRPADPSVDMEAMLPRPDYDPLRASPRPNPLPSDWPPEFEDEYQMQPRRGGQGIAGSSGRGFPSIGADDLRPPGLDAMNPLRDDRPHRGMYPTPEEILFSGDHTNSRGDSGGPGLPNRPPPGARYDPVFPGDENGLRRGGPGRGRGPGMGGFNPFGGVGGMNHDSMFG